LAKKKRLDLGKKKVGALAKKGDSSKKRLK
jgi:hypothetical protein